MEDSLETVQPVQPVFRRSPHCPRMIQKNGVHPVVAQGIGILAVMTVNSEMLGCRIKMIEARKAAHPQRSIRSYGDVVQMFGPSWMVSICNRPSSLGIEVIETVPGRKPQRAVSGHRDSTHDIAA